jgi:PAS domain-containing protein
LRSGTFGLIALAYGKKQRGLFRADEAQPATILAISIDISAAKATEEALREQSRRLEWLYRTGAAISAELSLERIVQLVTEAATDVTGARFGAFFYTVVDEAGECLTLYTLFRWIPF